MSLLKEKKGLIMGVANDKSIAWGIADSLHRNGAEIAFTYQNEKLKSRVEALANECESDIIMPCDVSETPSDVDLKMLLAPPPPSV